MTVFCAFHSCVSTPLALRAILGEEEHSKFTKFIESPQGFSMYPLPLCFVQSWVKRNNIFLSLLYKGLHMRHIPQW